MIGSRLKELIKQNNIKQKDLCEATGISSSRISNYIHNNRNPDLETLSRIAAFFKVELDYFVQDVSSPPTPPDIPSPRVKLSRILLSNNPGMQPPFWVEVDIDILEPSIHSGQIMYIDRAAPPFGDRDSILMAYNGNAGIYKAYRENRRTILKPESRDTDLVIIPDDEKMDKSDKFFRIHWVAEKIFPG
ncbi:helix-turn-helix domain-containing protein [Limisalsivibrio acetivorans]|uniref:helix-turn-helix domain-containing protein n=1 Tax=Limisalsivibrio acetivorans TaxID=1304888 RepID=UPI0003B5FE84|nr:helix-turn-helix transcriptional regulator [Limisalsivibrio acetivorans]